MATYNSYNITFFISKYIGKGDFYISYETCIKNSYTHDTVLQPLKLWVILQYISL